MATWTYTEHPAIYELRSIINEYALRHERPQGYTDEQYGDYILRELLTKPVLLWHAELEGCVAEMRARDTEALLNTKEVDDGSHQD
jgi:hypothetical protein